MKFTRHLDRVASRLAWLSGLLPRFIACRWWPEAPGPLYAVRWCTAPEPAMNLGKQRQAGVTRPQRVAPRSARDACRSAHRRTQDAVTGLGEMQAQH